MKTEYMTRAPPGESPWYYRNRIDEITTIYSLLNANTKKNSSRGMIKFSNIFRESLKAGSNGNDPAVLDYLLNKMDLIPYLQDTDYWGVYPSSDSSKNSILEYFRKHGESLSGSGSEGPLFLRKSKAQKRHGKLCYVRIIEGCDNQFETMKVNPQYRYKLPGSSVCILDDYSTYGTSCETARHLLKKAGVKNLTFLTIGKYGTDYFKYKYTLKGDVFGKYSYGRKTVRHSFTPTGDINHNSTDMFLKYMRAFYK